jgi:poly-gamma-glutamate synthesis protein (capsule biosynthesis protein)
MPRADTLRWLRELGVVAVGVANNHARDLGAEAYAAMVADLRAAGLTVLEHGRPQAVGPLRLTALRDLDNTPRPRDALIVDAELAAPAADIAFLHWGLEYGAEPGDRERRLAGALRKAGVPLVVGAHPHRASDRIALVDGLDTLLVYSLGNFVFDQRAPRASGAVLQVSVFAQGTRAVRLIPLTDVYTLGRAPR